jgi:predicted dehydrogenase
VGELRWGVFGTGYVARKFALGLRASPGAEIVAVASRSRERAKDFASGVGATAAATSYEDMITLDSVDAIYIATPAHLHRDHAILCLNAGKPALIEKPMALDASQAREIVAASRANNSFCMEAMWTRFTPLVREVKRRVTAGELGQLRLLTGSFCTAEHVDASRHLFNPGMGGGALLDRAVYPISLDRLR